MPKKLQKKIKEESTSKVDALLDEVQDRFDQSERYIENLRTEWDDKEAMLLGVTNDSISRKTKSQINDPRLSTIVFERAARVMNREPSGRAYAESEDDMGKNMFMNLLIPHFRKRDNDQYSHLLKLRFMDLYSHVYGTCYGLVYWKVDPKSGFIGPASNVLRMRDCFPQPGISSLSLANYFDHRTWVSIEWLKQQDAEFWDMAEITKLESELKERKDSGDKRGTHNSEQQSYIERHRFPDNVQGSAKFPQVELITEYRGDKWISWTPQYSSEKTSRPHILRQVTSQFDNGWLPIIEKHSFPLLDSPIGLGEYERGQTLQKGMNSLINLYMDGVKYSIFPPIAVDPNNVVPSSIKWGGGNRWYMNNPGRDVQPVNLSPQGLATFNSTYDFMLSALNNQSGTTSVSGEQGQSGLGKTPEAVRYVQDRETSRDEWDRFMMEDTIQQEYERWIYLITHKLDADVEMRLFGEEARRIAERYPDIKQLFGKQITQSKSKESMKVKVGSKDLGGPNENYDWVTETGSTMKARLDDQGEAVTDVLKSVIENGETFETALNKKNKSLDVAELFQRWLEARRVPGIDRIIVDLQTQPAQTPEAAAAVAQTQGQTPEEQMQAAALAAAQSPEVAPTGEMPAQVPVGGEMPAPAEEVIDFRDPDIAQFAQELLGGVGGIPPSA